MPFAYAGLAISAYSAYNSNKNGKKAAAGSAQGAADPFASQREGYQSDLRTLMNGEFKPTDPSYKWRFDQGMESVNRGAAASGMLNSGNRLAELVNFGQGQASTEYSNQFARLSRLAGADIGSPSTAAQIQQQNSANSSAGMQQLVGKAGTAISNWWSGLNSGGGGGGGASNVTPVVDSGSNWQNWGE